MITISAFGDEIDPNLKTQMDACQANGINCIDVRGIDNINVSDMTLSQVAEYKKQFDDRGFKVPCIGSPVGKIRIDEDFGKQMELLRHSCVVAKAFGTDMIRIFSFYPSQGANIDDQRDAVMERLAAMVDVAQKADCILMHENESDIYGRKAEGVLDIFRTIKSKHLQSIFDPANFVAEEVRPYDDCWNKGLRELTVYFHIKDKKIGAPTCVPAGEGDGQFDQIFAEVKKMNFSGYMTLEPHMKRAEQSKGFTGPELFTKAVKGLKDMLTKHGIAYAR